MPSSPACTFWRCVARLRRKKPRPCSPKNRPVLRPTPPTSMRRRKERLVFHARFAHVQPHKVRALQRRHGHLRQSLGHKGADQIAVFADVVHAAVQPLVAGLVGGALGHHGKEVGVVGVDRVHLLFQCLTGFFIGDDDGGLAHAGDVEGLGGRGEHDGVRQERAQRGMHVGREGEGSVDLVGDDAHLVRLDERRKLFKLRARPHAAHGVVRAAQEHALYAALKGILEGGKVHLPALRRFQERAFGHGAAGAQYGLAEGPYTGGWISTRSPGAVSA